MESFNVPEDKNWHYEIGSGQRHPSERRQTGIIVSPRTHKKSITSAEFMQLIGLFALAQKHNVMLQDILQSALSITGETNPHGHTADAVYGEDPDMMQLLNRLGLKIED